MKKEILSGLGVLFCVAILISGCSKPEEKKVEAPPVKKQIVQEKAPAVKQEMAEKVEPTAESATLEDQAIEVAKEMGQQALEKEIEKLPEEQQQAIDIAKQYSGNTRSGQVEQAVTDEATKDAKTSLEQSAKEKAIEQGMKLPSKY